MAYKVLLNKRPLADQSGATEFRAIDTAKVLVMDTILKMNDPFSNVVVNVSAGNDRTDFICRHHGGVDIVTLIEVK